MGILRFYCLECVFLVKLLKLAMGSGTMERCGATVGGRGQTLSASPSQTRAFRESTCFCRGSDADKKAARAFESNILPTFCLLARPKLGNNGRDQVDR